MSERVLDPSYAKLVLGSGPATTVANSSWVTTNTNQQHLICCLYRGQSPSLFLSPRASSPPSPVMRDRQAPFAVHSCSPEFTHIVVNRSSLPFSPLCIAVPSLISWKRVPSRSNKLCLIPTGGQYGNSPGSRLSLRRHSTPFPWLLLPWVCIPERNSST